MSSDVDTCPLPYFGGKWSMRNKILPLLPPHEHYVEPFGGSAAILLSKKPCGGVETYNDKWSAIADFFRVLKDPELFEQFYRRVQAIGYSRELWREYRDTWHEPDDIVERVTRWYVVARQSFSGDFGVSLSTTVTKADRGMATSCSKWRSAVDGLSSVHERLLEVQVENASWETVLGRYDGEGYLAYCDPPYVPETRRSGQYEHEMDAEGHVALVDALIDYTGAVVLSGYNHDIYNPLINAGWKRDSYDVACWASGKTEANNLLGEGACEENQRRTESIWRNPEAVRRCRQRDEPLFSGA